MSLSPCAIQAVVQAAQRTFSRSYQQFVLNSDEFKASMKDLKLLLDGIRSHDVGLERSKVLHNRPSSPCFNPDAAPVTYIKIHEDHDVSIGIFVVKAGSRIPLHNHPNMHGLLKVRISYFKSKPLRKKKGANRTIVGLDCLFS